MFNDLDLFSGYMKIFGIPKIKPDCGPIPALSGKRLGIINGSSWITLWSYYFGRKILPGVKLINAGNEAVQLNFIGAHERGERCPPQINIDLFAKYALDFISLYPVDAILITCSTMNRSFETVKEAVKPYGIPVVQIDEPMMESSVLCGGKTLVIATHGPTVDSTQELLHNTAKKLGKPEPDFLGATIEDAFELLGSGDIEGHNKALAQCISENREKHRIDQVVLAQLSMSVLSVQYPDMEKHFGIPVFTSGIEGFKYIRKIFEEGRPAK